MQVPLHEFMLPTCALHEVVMQLLSEHKLSHSAFRTNTPECGLITTENMTVIWTLTVRTSLDLKFASRIYFPRACNSTNTYLCAWTISLEQVVQFERRHEYQYICKAEHCSVQIIVASSEQCFITELTSCPRLI